VTAVLSEDSPASAPPAAPIRASVMIHSRGLSPAKFQIAQATADTASVSAIAMPCPVRPKCGVKNGTVTTTRTSMISRTACTAGGTSIRPIVGPCRSSASRPLGWPPCPSPGTPSAVPSPAGGRGMSRRRA
jgi:hypothetical protein